ncbi:hypothetical protein IWQ56_004268, partial [Coemansia nantahalensis]
TYDHFQNKDDDEEEAVAAAQQQYGAEDAGPNRFQQFFKKEDGSFDKSHVALAAALAGGLAGGLAFAGKKTYDHYRKDDEPQSDQYQYQNQPYPPQGGQYQNQPYPPQGGQYQNQPYPPQGGQYQDKPYPPQGGQYQNQPYPPQGAHPPNPYGEQPAGDNSPNAVKAFFTDSDGTLNKSRIAAVSALLLGGGVAVKKTYDHFQDKDEEEQAQEADENETNRVKAFFTDADGTLNKSRIAGVSALLLGSGFAVKKTYDHFQNKDEEEEAAAAAAQQQYGAEDTSPNRFQQFFKKEDGSFDKSHLALAAALAGGLTIGGKKAYDHYKKNDEPAGGQYQNQPYPPQGGQYQNQPYPSQGAYPSNPYGEQPTGDKSPNAVKRFFVKPDGKVDKSHALAAGALGVGAAVLVGKMLKNGDSSSSDEDESDRSHRRSGRHDGSRGLAQDDYDEDDYAEVGSDDQGDGGYAQDEYNEY